MATAVVGALVMAGAIGACSGSEWDASEQVTSVDPAAAQAAREVVEQAIRDDHLKAVVLRITKDGENVLTEAWGEAMPGLPATTDVHFRNGAVAIGYVAIVLLQLADEGVVSLDDRLSTYLPDVEHADDITLGQLAAMTSGLRDYVPDPEFTQASYDDPFRVWQPEELWPYATRKPLWYEPGTNWNYAHTNYLLLGRALEVATGTSVHDLVERRVLDPLGLDDTDDPGSPWMPDPVLHSYTGERHDALGIASDAVPYEDATYWSPSWTITQGAIQYTDIYDLDRSIIAIGRGDLLSDTAYELMTSRDQATFGGPVEGCPSCRRGTTTYTYGLGVVERGDWLLQNPMFAGLAGTTGYLPEEGVAVSVFVTFDAEAYGPDNDFSPSNAALPLFVALSEVVAPDHAAPSS